MVHKDTIAAPCAIELFRLRLGLDLLSRHTAILKGVVQFYTLVIGSRIKYLSGDKG